ncbi:MAG: NADH-quinone oxidoreductase subunit C [Selenomonas sp.]|nr:NADH-quinone oxidoreductase subunit C [Selenomonas sp.]
MELKIKEISAGELLSEAKAYSEGGRHPLTAMFGRDERHNGGGFSVYAVFEFPETREHRALKAVLAEGETSFASLSHALPAASWFEREIQDMFGLVAENHPDPRPLVLHENFPKGFHPLRKDAPQEVPFIEGKHTHMHTAGGEGTFQVPVGPIHAGIIEPGHFRFSQAGESMLQLDAKLFYTHRGLEKTMEGKTALEALPIVERICGACTAANTWSYCQAVETASGTAVPRRAEILRTFILEIERITNHVGDLGNIPAGVGFSFAVSIGTRAKEMMMRLQDSLTGNRFLRGFFVPGGTARDFTAEACAQAAEVLREVEKNVLDLERIFAQQDGFQDRVRTTGIVRNKTARDLAMVGVGARASGYAHDSRADFGYGVYPELSLKVVTENSGDVAARILVRIGELKESFRLAFALLEMLGREQGEHRTELGTPQGEAAGLSESARGSSFCYVAFDKEGRLDRIFVRSASYANWPALPIAVQGDIIPDFPLINKSFELCYACLDR